MGLKVLAIDQSTRKTGYSILDGDRSLINYGVIDCGKIGTTSEEGHTEKRNYLKKEIVKILNKYPDIIQVVCEGVIYKQNADTLIKLSKTQATIQDLCYELKTHCFVFNISSWRNYLPVKFGRKREEIKANTKQYILSLYPEIGEKQAEDVYDATAIGVAYLNMVLDIGQDVSS